MPNTRPQRNRRKRLNPGRRRKQRAANSQTNTMYSSIQRFLPCNLMPESLRVKLTYWNTVTFASTTPLILGISWFRNRIPQEATQLFGLYDKVRIHGITVSARIVNTSLTTSQNVYLGMAPDNDTSLGFTWIKENPYHVNKLVSTRGGQDRCQLRMTYPTNKTHGRNVLETDAYWYTAAESALTTPKDPATQDAILGVFGVSSTSQAEGDYTIDYHCEFFTLKDSSLASRGKFLAYHQLEQPIEGPFNSSSNGDESGSLIIPTGMEVPDKPIVKGKVRVPSNSLSKASLEFYKRG